MFSSPITISLKNIKLIYH